MINDVTIVGGGGYSYKDLKDTPIDEFLSIVSRLDYHIRKSKKAK